MPVGQSNRVVIDTDPDLKQELHAVLRAEEKSMKRWFEENARAYIAQRAQLGLFGQSEFKAETE